MRVYMRDIRARVSCVCDVHTRLPLLVPNCWRGCLTKSTIHLATATWKASRSSPRLRKRSLSTWPIPQVPMTRSGAFPRRVPLTHWRLRTGAVVVFTTGSLTVSTHAIVETIVSGARSSTRVPLCRRGRAQSRFPF